METLGLVVLGLAVLVFVWKVALKDPFGIYPKK